ncbi:MAG: iron ABC transporter permease [Bradyrhizobiaceae bacterium]|nr:MAG: iron ABC transporter permease [Bradyrhizobiaceae bacterium]
MRLSRRALLHGLLVTAMPGSAALAQGFAGLGEAADGFEKVVPGRALAFPADHGPHPGFRIEWWYVTANLRDQSGVPYGAQWTLFRQAITAGPEDEGWASRQLWMGHAAVTSASEHRFSQRLARGGVGVAGAEALPFHAWIDAWDMRGVESFSPQNISPVALSASSNDFAFDLKLEASQPLVLQGEGGYSRKSEQGQASYYYSQPFFKADGDIEIAGKRIGVTGQAWMDREWSSQPLASDQKGWDWISLHLASGTKLMLFRLRQSGGHHYISANWIEPDGHSTLLASSAVALSPLAQSSVAGRKLPTEWDIVIPSRDLKIKITALNPQSWMATSIPYWEGPVSIQGSDKGVGYLEMTGY